MEATFDFKEYVNQIESTPGYKKPLAFALGVKRSKNDKVLDVTFPIVNYDESFGSAATLLDVLDVSEFKNQTVDVSLENLTDAYSKFGQFHDEIEKHRNIMVIKSLIDNYSSSNSYADVSVIAYFLFDKDQPVESAEEAYFKLNCLSRRKVEPHGLSLDGMFGKLSNVAWTNKGPILPEDVELISLKYVGTDAPLVVSHVDKFPYLVNYHIPSGTRIASGSQVRLGAYLGEGTTVMPAGYVNFNAGTKGNAMVEGRISAGVVVDENSDIGGGASIMGTLSGGNKNVISIGKECLLGANAGTGISLGFGCTIAAGVYVTAGAKVWLYDGKNKPVDIDGNLVSEGENIVKGAELSGKDKLLFINDTRNGHLVCKPNPKTIELNTSLHVND